MICLNLGDRHPYSGELLIGKELAGAAQNTIQAIEREGNTFNNQRRQKKYVLLEIVKQI